MKFSDALICLEAGREVCRSNRIYKGAWIFLKNGEIFVNTETNNIISWIPSQNDILADDWSVVARGTASAIGFATA